MSPAPRLVAVAPPPPDDAADVRAAQGGDQLALRRLFERHQRAVLGYCLASTGRDRDRALDLLQDTFTRAFRALPGLAEPERFRAWLFAIAANVCRSCGAQEERLRRAREALELEQEVASGGDDLGEREGRIAAVQRVLAHVSDARVRQIAQLKYGDPEHTTRDIAERLGIPHGTVTVKLMRFRAAIRRELCRALASGGVTP